MRKAIFGTGLAALAATGLLAVAPLPGHHMGRTRYSAGQRQRRSWYMPHQGPREIARRLRQEERNRERQIERGSQYLWDAKNKRVATGARLSRRGNVL